jgi:hypothetical protein
MNKSKEILFEKVNAFINTIADFEDVQSGEEFLCYPTTKEIFIDTKNYRADEFIDTLFERTNLRDISIFTWCLLHEVGHCMTEKYIDVRANNHCQYVKKKIAKGKIASINYYYLADEKKATNWAIRYATKNFEKVKAFDNDIRGLII